MGLVIGRGPTSINFPDFSGSNGGVKGYAVYNDTVTETTKIQAAAGTWTNITSDGLGAGTNIQHLPDGVTRLWDTTTNKIVLNELSNENYVVVRLQLKVKPLVNESVISLRVNWTTQSNNEFDLVKRVGQLNEGAGAEYEISDQFVIYVGDDDARGGSGEIQIKCEGDVSVEVDTIFIGVN